MNRIQGYSVFALVVTALLLPACTQEVKRQSSYYPGQFSHVHNQSVPTAKSRSGSDSMNVRVVRKKDDPVGDFFRGIGNVFSGDEGDDNNSGGRVMTREELAAFRAQRAKERSEAQAASQNNPDTFDDQSREMHNQTDPGVRR